MRIVILLRRMIEVGRSAPHSTQVSASPYHHHTSPYLSQIAVANRLRSLLSNCLDRRSRDSSPATSVRYRLPVSLVFKCFCWFRHRSLQSLGRHRDGRDDHNNNPRDNEEHGAHRYPVRKCLQPPVHHPPRKRPRDQVGNGHWLEKSFRQQHHNSPTRSTRAPCEYQFRGSVATP